MPIWEGCLERFVDFHAPAYHFERTPRAKSSILIDFNDSIRIFTSKAAYVHRDLSLCFVKLQKSTFSYDLYVFLRSLRTVILHVKTRANVAAPVSACRPLISALFLHKKQLPPPLKREASGSLGWAVERVVRVGGLADWLVGLVWLVWLVGWYAGVVYGV